MLKKIVNPILRGFNPDPSIVRVGDDYYIATSTFEWFPGVQIHHSKDLIHWKLITRVLDRTSQLDMIGNPPSGGIWAPCLTYSDGLFYLVYTNVKTEWNSFHDCHNYLVTAPSIYGPWSEPVYLNSSGFDPSLFHDDDGRKWLVNMLWDFRKTGEQRFGGIVIQEYCPKRKRLVGEIQNIFKGTELGLTEAPHIYKVNGYYYLMTAEGGTSYEHAVTMARSRNLFGPYEVDPKNPILTARYNDELPLKKAGHASIVQTQTGQWYMVYLCARPLPGSNRCVLGRETAIQEVVWTEDNWLRTKNGRGEPELIVDAPDLPEYKFENEPFYDDFDLPELSIHFQTLRIPLGEKHMSLTERPGYLRLKGGESLSSRHEQSLVARRQQSFVYTATTCVEFEPDTFQQMAGLICIYNSSGYYYLRITRDDNLGKCLGIIICDRGVVTHGYDVPINGWTRIYLRAKVNMYDLNFMYSKDGAIWQPIGPTLDMSKLSDEYVSEGHFTGAFVGLCCQDVSGTRKHADFDFFEYIAQDR